MSCRFPILYVAWSNNKFRASFKCAHKTLSRVELVRLDKKNRIGKLELAEKVDFASRVDLASRHGTNLATRVGSPEKSRLRE